MSYPSKLKYYILLLLIFVTIISSCSNNKVQDLIIDSYILFDYSTKMKEPLERFSVFFVSDNHIAISKLKIINSDTGYEWQIDKICHNGDLYWCQNLSSVEGFHIPRGQYSAKFFFEDGTEYCSNFLINYPDFIMNNDSSILTKLKNNGFKHISEVYDKTKLKNLNFIQNKNCYIDGNRHVLCFLPEINN